MIKKYFGFGKLLIQSFIILLISCFGLLGSSFVNAVCSSAFNNGVLKFDGGQVHQIGSTYSSTQSNSIDNGVLKYGEFFSQSLGYGKKVFAFNSKNLIFWSENGLPYSFRTTDYQTIQGYFSNYIVCDAINPDGINGILGVNHCTVESLSAGSLQTLSSFFSTVKNTDYFGYQYDVGSNTQKYGICVSSSELGKSVCFIYVQTASCGSDCNCTLKNSIDLPVNTNFDNISNSIIGTSPGLSNNSGGSENNNSNIVISSSACTKGKALQRYENNGYTKRLCYGGYNDFTIWDGNPVGVLPYYGSGLDIEEIWLETANYYQGGLTGTAQSYSAWFGYRRQLYSTYKRGGYSTNPFVNTPLVMFGLFGAVDTYGVNYNSNSILEYCDLKLFTSDYNVAYSGVNQSNVCSLIDLVVDQVTDGSGNVIIGIDTNNIVGGSGSNCLGSGCDQNLSGNNKVYENGSNFILDFSDELKSNFGNILNNNYGLGILPVYITIALCGLILFRFMAH